MSTLSTVWAISLSSLISGASSPTLISSISNYQINANSGSNQQEKVVNLKNDHHETSISSKLIKPKYVIEFSAIAENEWLILVNKQPTFKVKDLPSAAIATAKLVAIMNTPNFDPKGLVPVAIKGEYIGKYQDVTLFKISKPEVVNPSLNLTQWINNLRVAAGAEPLTLTEAQKQMYKLALTDEQIDGIASWYGPYFQGRQTASGEQFEQQDFTAAHPSLPFDTYLKVTNQSNGKSVVVRINDRGPYVGERNLDLSYAAAIALNSDEIGVVPITATVLVPFSTN
ncbi:septal ring lytic transglycosylase RlpA family protein [Pseudanabaena sp. FACHB-1998]|uniref:septal ring lytic transglycosylase RlpA family protein n=1 Tax=Pseudanabaena sp. FACHB-1998 TaxID=2692858 RepID=UPI001681BDD5|nr:septal ring lytic transglycosylase RlpA family protein [Pseudanabaena sp. FACHB-1998]MBD2176069.1 septal ring lytic transglycosylase RlpA family protein [Pseudanabaena sp. FACHB-1998]